MLRLISALDDAARRAGHLFATAFAEGLTTALPGLPFLDRRDMFILALASAAGRNGLPWVPDPQSGELRPLTSAEWAAQLVEDADLLVAASNIGPVHRDQLLDHLRQRLAILARVRSESAGA